jgi:hypothetical protein
VTTRQHRRNKLHRAAQSAQTCSSQQFAASCSCASPPPPSTPCCAQDELLSTELLFRGLLTGMAPEEAVALMSALVFQVGVCVCFWGGGGSCTTHKIVRVERKQSEGKHD